ncbi:unnamed protein product [Linum tenue]|uniref:Uncharacterized protein n=1 Tax=Linum tenue TaxID=586396 RepID=A0AAV0LCG7_9ROSI|nr:unnamed protein product [Linum tenue]
MQILPSSSNIPKPSTLHCLPVATGEWSFCRDTGVNGRGSSPRICNPSVAAPQPKKWEETTDEMFEDGLNLNLHAKVDSWEEANEILDVILFDEIEETMIYAARNTIVQECVLSILRLGVAASTESPEQRMSICDVAVELLGIKGKLVKKWVPASKQKTYWTSTSVREDGRNLDICSRNTSIQECEAEI